MYKLGDMIITNYPASEGKVYEIIMKRGEHYKIKSKDGYRYCREWRIERLATKEEVNAR